MSKFYVGQKVRVRLGANHHWVTDGGRTQLKDWFETTIRGVWDGSVSVDIPASLIGDDCGDGYCHIRFNPDYEIFYGEVEE